MNVASLELCKDLYQRSGWKGTDYFYQFIEYSDLSTGYHLINPVLEIPLHANAYPAYDLGYLLRKLWPLFMTLEAHADSTQGKYFTICFEPDWKEKPQPIIVRVWENTPEDAACKLAIELFKQGVLKED